KLQLHTNDWQVRHARRILQERAAAGKVDPQIHMDLTRIARGTPDVTRKLRALWALHATGGLNATANLPTADPRFRKQPLDLRGPRFINTQPLLPELLEHSDENLRWWSVQILCEDKN